MNNRKLKKILKQNAINTPHERSSRRSALNIPRRALLRTAQIAACLLLVCAMGVGYVAMVRFVGRPGENIDGTGGPAFQIGATTPSDTTADAQSTIESDDTTPNTNTDTFKGKKLYLVSPMASGVTGDLWEFSSPDTMTANSVDAKNLQRFMKTEEVLGCNLVHAYFSDDTSYLSWVKTSALTGGYDGAIVTGDASIVLSLAREGLCENLLATENAAFSASCWPEDMVNELSVNGKLYFASGVISPNTVTAVNVVFANNDIDALLGIDIHGTVMEGKWTLDKMYELAAQGGGNLNGVETDCGLVLTDESLRALSTAVGVRIADNSASAHASLTDGTALEFTNTLADMIQGGTLRLSTKASSEHIATLFHIDTVASAATYDEQMYQILPMPALTEGGKHISPVGDGAMYYTIRTGSDTAFASMVLYCLATYADEMNANEYIFHRYAQNTESVQNLEIALDNMSFTLDSFLTASVTNTTIKNAVNAATSEAREAILTQEYLGQIITAQLGKLAKGN